MSPSVMRRIFKHRRDSLLMVADADRGKEISQTTVDFLEAAAGKPAKSNGARSIRFITGN